MCSSTYHFQINGQAKLSNQTLTATLRIYAIEHQGEWDAFASSLTCVSTSQVNCLANTRPFDLVLNQRISIFLLLSIRSAGTVLTAAEQRSGILAKLQNSSGRARAFIQYSTSQKRYKSYLDRRLSKGRENINNGTYVFTDVSGGVITISKLAHEVEGPHQVMRQHQHVVVMDRKELVKRTTVGRAALAPLPAGGPTTPPERASVVIIWDKILERLLRQILEIRNCYLNNDSQLECHQDWVSILRLHESLVSRCDEKLFSCTFLVWVGQCQNGTNSLQK